MISMVMFLQVYRNCDFDVAGVSIRVRHDLEVRLSCRLRYSVCVGCFRGCVFVRSRNRRACMCIIYQVCIVEVSLCNVQNDPTSTLWVKLLVPKYPSCYNSVQETGGVTNFVEDVPSVVGAITCRQCRCSHVEVELCEKTGG